MTNPVRSALLAAAVALAPAMSGCGGGGGGVAPKTVATPAPQPSPTPAPQPSPTPAPDYRNEWLAMIDELNERQGNAYPDQISISTIIQSWPTTLLAHHRADQAVRAFNRTLEEQAVDAIPAAFEKARAAMARYRADYARVKALKAEGRGHITAPGIDRIPLSAVKVTKSQMATMFVVEEGGFFDSESHYGTEHLDSMAEIACHSYIEACADAFGDDKPLQVRFFALGEPGPNGTEWLLSFPESVKIVSSSYLGDTPAVRLGADLRFASIASNGNADRDTHYPPKGFCGNPDRTKPVTDYIECDWDPETNEDAIKERAAIAADKLLLVAGYYFWPAGTVFPATDSTAERDYEEDTYENGGTGCIGEGISEGCIWAPISFGGYPESETGHSSCSVVTERVEGCYLGQTGSSGTSPSAPHVAAALASVLAAFPETTPQNLIRLAKACAIPTPSLPGGVGRADFTCMTTMSDNGEWRLVSAEKFAELVSPMRMNAMIFPGDARIMGTFVGRTGKPVELGTSLRGAFSGASGIPGFSPGRAAGFFPIVADGDPSIGGGYMTDGGLFAAVAMGDRDGFFGLDWYSGTRAADMAIGYRHAYARFSRQWSADPPLIGSVRGDAVGLTAEYSFGLGAATGLRVAGHMDRFVGGRADTVFGAVDIEASPWNRSATLSLDHSLLNGARLSLSANADWFEHGDARGLSFDYSHRF